MSTARSRLGVGDAPAFDGVLGTSDADLAAAADDFGHLVHRDPLAVLKPGSAADVASLVRYARERGLAVVPRGAGHTVDGQAQIRDGIVVDLSTLADVGAPERDRIGVFAGAPWSAVVDRTLPAGLVPPVLPDFLALSVGGTLSAGGVSGTSHRYGCVADNVYDLDVVTPAGDLARCSPERDRHLFDAVRGTQGEYGIIVRATLALRPADTHARRYLLSYRDASTFLLDQLRLIDDRRFGHVGGQVQIVAGEPPRYVLEAVTTFTAPARPDDRALLEDLNHERGTEQIATSGYREFLDRLIAFETRLRSIGSWQHHPHPRCNVLLPGRHAEAIVADVVGGLTAELLGSDLGGSVLLYPIPTARLLAPRMPKARDPITVVLGVQRTAPPGRPDLVAAMRTANAALLARVHGVGGTGYSAPTPYHEALHGRT